MKKSSEKAMKVNNKLSSNVDEQQDEKNIES